MELSRDVMLEKNCHQPFPGANLLPVPGSR
jgi:hypothetical protein